jgi:sirohydrochlorin ferrochelatase
MIPYFLSAGVHLTRDLVEVRDAIRRRHPGVEVRLATALGPHPLLDDLVSERIRQVAGGLLEPSVPAPPAAPSGYPHGGG